MHKLSFSVRPASRDDLPLVAEIEKTANTPPWSEAAFTAELEKKHAHFWVVTDNETDSILYAYIVFSFPGDFAHIQTLGVHSEHRRKKIGEYLLRQVIRFLLKKGAEKVVLELRKSNTSALKLYQSLGFIIVHTAKSAYPDGEDGYSMSCQLQSEEMLKAFHSDPDAAEEEFEADDDVRSKKNLN